MFILGLLAISAGMWNELVLPMPSPDNETLDPLPGIVKSEIPDNPFEAVASLGKEMLLAGGLLGTSILQLGIASFLYLLSYCAVLGGNIGWFGKFPGTSVWHGLAAFGSHAIFEFLAFTLVAAFSMWVGFAIIIPGKEKSRLEVLTGRFKKAVFIVPSVVVLLIASITVEATVSINLERRFASQAIATEETREVKDPKGQWTMEMPFSWERTAYEKSSENEKAYVTLNKIYPAFIEVRVAEGPGVYSNEDIKYSYAPVVKEQIQTLGLRSVEGPLEMKIGSYDAYYFKFTGSDSAIRADDTTAEYYVISQPNPVTETTTIYSIFVRGIPDGWYEFSEPLIQDVIQTFRIAE